MNLYVENETFMLETGVDTQEIAVDTKVKLGHTQEIAVDMKVKLGHGVDMKVM